VGWYPGSALVEGPVLYYNPPFTIEIPEFVVDHFVTNRLSRQLYGRAHGLGKRKVSCERGYYHLRIRVPGGCERKSCLMIFSASGIVTDPGQDYDILFN
jgi:hypothetical protein